MSKNNTLTFEDEVNKFQGFSTLDGELADGTPSADEKKAAEKEDTDTDEQDEVEVAETDEQDEGAETEKAETDEEGESDAEKAETDEDATEEQQKQKPKGKKTYQERINELTRARHTAERVAAQEREARADLERRLAALERGLTETRDDTKTIDDGAPDPSKFEFGEMDPKYIAAVTEHTVRRTMRAEQAQREKDRQGEAARAEAAKYAEKKSALEVAGAAKYDDFEDVVIGDMYDKDTNPGGWPLSADLGKLILDSEQGPDIAYHLASNPKEAWRVFRQTPMEQAAYFGRLEAKFASTSVAKSKGQKDPATKTTKAPPPLTKKAKGAGGKVSASADTTDFKQFEALAMGGKR